MHNKASLSLWLLLLWGACNQPAPDMPTSAGGQKILQLPYAKKFPSPHVELYTVAHFLSDAACDQLKNLIKGHLVPSRITGQDTDPDKYKHQKIRTSSTAYLALLRDPAEQAFVDLIRQKISQALGIPRSRQFGDHRAHS